MAHVRVLALGSAFLSEVLLTALLPLYPRIESAGRITETGFGFTVALFPVGFLLTSGLIWRLSSVRAGLLARIGLISLGLTAPLLHPELGLASLGAVRMLHGAASGVLWASALAVTLAAAPANRGGRSLGSLFGAGIAGSLVGPVLGASAATSEHPAMPLGIVTLGCLGLLTLARSFDTVNVLTTAGARAGRPPAAFVISLIPPATFSAMAVLVPVVLTMTGAGAGLIAITFLIAGAAEIPASRIAGHWSDRLTPVRLLVPLFIAGGLSCFLIGVVDDLAAAAFATVLATVLVGALYPPVLSLLGQQVIVRGGSGIEAAALSNIAWAIGQAAGAALMAVAGPTSASLPIALLIAAPCVIGATLVPWVRHRSAL